MKKIFIVAALALVGFGCSSAGDIGDSGGRTAPPPAPTVSPSESPTPDVAVTSELIGPAVDDRTTPPVTDDGPTVRPGAFCSPEGARGTYRGVTYTCKGPGQSRWRR